jgi:hypothetical protein
MHEPSLSAAEQTDLRQYRNVSRPAIGALLLGLVSPVGLAHPLLWVVPLAGIALAVTAIISIARHNAELTGRQMAIWGLALSLFFGSWAMGQVALRGWILQSQTRALADHWLTLWKEGKFEQAHQLTMPSTERQPAGTDLRAFYPTSEHSMTGLRSMWATPPNRWLKAMHDEGGSFQFRSLKYHSQDSRFEDSFVLLYDIQVVSEGETTTYAMTVYVTRKVYDGLGIVDWYIHDTKVPGAKPF